MNKYEKPTEFYWPAVSLWWSLHGLLWVDHSLILMAGAVAAAAAIAWRSEWGKSLWRDPLFGCSLWAVGGFVLFMTVQNHPQPRYFAVPAFFCFFVVSLGAGTLLRLPGSPVGGECGTGGCAGCGGSARSAHGELRNASGVLVCECGGESDALY